MIKRLAFYLSLVFILTVTIVRGQDIHFSQFYMSPLTLNPALTGVMNCNTRIVGNYRNQWASVLGNNAYNTYSVSYDQKMPVGRYDYFGFGGNIWSDVAGSLIFRRLHSNYPALTPAVWVVIAGNRIISWSVQKQVLHSEALIILMHNGRLRLTMVNSALPVRSGEGDLPDNFLFGDVGLGLLWFSVLDKKTNFYIGSAINHLNQANLSFYRQMAMCEKYYTKIVLHAGGQFPMGDGDVPSYRELYFFNQGPSLEINAGNSFRFNLDGGDDQSFQFGGMGSSGPSF